MSETHEIFAIIEFETISFECPACGTEVIFRADGEDAKQQRLCPECSKEIPAAGHLLHAYRALYADAKRLGTTVRLRAKVD